MVSELILVHGGRAGVSELVLRHARAGGAAAGVVFCSGAMRSSDMLVKPFNYSNMQQQNRLRPAS